jgi:SAM-dependent methyltransferase
MSCGEEKFETQRGGDDNEDDDNFPDTLSDWEADENDDQVTIIDLFSNDVYHNLDQYLLDCQQKHGIDLISLIRCIGGDEIACIMMVNFIRSLVRDSQDSPITKDEIIRLIITKEFLSNEQFMHPVIPNDELLFLLGESINDFDPSKEEEAAEKDDQEWTQSNNYSFLNNVIGIPEPTLPTTKEEMLHDDNDPSLIGDYYFDGYSHIGIHETMLRDAARTQAYANALLSNASILQGKVVLDVGCGTGILSMLAARAGAKKVIGVDMSSILRTSQKVIEKNGLGDRIRLVRGRMEDLVLPLEEGEEIDVIVSEWMGYGLYFENMLPAVMYARDKFLRRAPDGSFPPWSIMPSHASLFVEAISVQDSAEEDRLLWWKDVYGFDMTDMVDLFLPEAQVDSVSHELVVSDRSLFHELSILTAGDAELDFVRPFQLVSLPLPPLLTPRLSRS